MEKNKVLGRCQQNKQKKKSRNHKYFGNQRNELWQLLLSSVIGIVRTRQRYSSLGRDAIDLSCQIYHTRDIYTSILIRKSKHSVQNACILCFEDIIDDDETNIDH